MVALVTMTMERPQQLSLWEIAQLPVVSVQATVARLTICPRCASALRTSYGEITCVTCGWSGPTHAPSSEDLKPAARLPRKRSER